MTLYARPAEQNGERAMPRLSLKLEACAKPVPPASPQRNTANYVPQLSPSPNTLPSAPLRTVSGGCSTVVTVCTCSIIVGRGGAGGTSAVRSSRFTFLFIDPPCTICESRAPSGRTSIAQLAPAREVAARRSAAAFVTSGSAASPSAHAATPPRKTFPKS